MRESQRRINEYKRALPRLKEKVIAVALLLAVSASMMVTVTFAWVALSTNPEVSGVNTSIASNGNLEIALATGTLTDASAPGASQIGDSNLDTLLRNVTWGNLINLGDARYGLDNIVLRPALLNEFGLVDNPLYGPVYDETGRVIDMNTNFGYAAWSSSSGRFESSNQLGVRAITSMTYGEAGAVSEYKEKLDKIKAANSKAQSNYQNMAYNQDYMDALASMMTGYMVHNILKVNSSVGDMISDSEIKKTDLQQLASMYRSLMDSYAEFCDVFASLLNLQAELNGKEVSITGAELLALKYDTSEKIAYNALLDKGFVTYSDSDRTVGFVKSIDQFLSDYNILVADVVRIEKLISSISGSSVTWPNSPLVEGTEKRLIDDIIDNLVNVKECTITGGEYKDLKIKNVGATAALALKDAGTCETKITNGVLYNFDNITGSRIKNPKDAPLRLSVKVMGTQTIVSNVSTSATNSGFSHEASFVNDIIVSNFSAPVLISKDTCGFAVDFWVRTNAANSYLTLQGNVLTKTVEEPVKGKDKDGNEVDLYTITVKLQEEETEGESSDSEGGSILDGMATVSHDVYWYTERVESGQETEVLLYASNHTEVTSDSLGGQEVPSPIQKMESVEYVIGFEGDNRIWEGEQHSLLSVNSTTQGGGSCYVFYAETPVDQERSLELLKSMKIAFVSDKGELLATAYMDSDRHYADGGKVTVPMVLDSESLSIGVDEDGNPKYAITALEQNVPTRITALVYLDGTMLTNDKVLAAADIEGRMNIQFGSSVALYPLNNETLYNSELYAEVESISPNEFDYDTLSEGDTMTSNVKVRITGIQPNVVTTNFIRCINATQGSPEESFTLTDADGDGVWEGDYTFLSPGTYILHSVTMDGVERDLVVNKDEDGLAEYPTVIVNGFSITSVTYFSETYKMTDAGSFSGEVSLKFATNDPAKMPTSVIGKFLRGDGAAVNVNFVYNPTLGVWQGSADFVSSGEYTMQYVVLDGEYTELTEGQQHTIELVLGMRVEVETTSPTLMFYNKVMTAEGEKVEIRDENKNLVEKLEMQVWILDNNGNIIPNLAGASLTYSMVGAQSLYAQLYYNEGEQYYEGEFLMKEAGTYSFANVGVTMGENHSTMTSANSDAPVFTIVPPEPPAYLSNSADEGLAQLVSGDSGKLTVSLKDSSSATVYAQLRNAKGDVAYVKGTMKTTADNICIFEFDVDGGLWTLEGVSVFGVFDEDGNYEAVPTVAEGGLTEEQYNKGIVFANGVTDGFTPLTVAVLPESAITVSVKYDGANFTSKNASGKVGYFGKDYSANTVSGTFMQEHMLSAGGIQVSVLDGGLGLIGSEYFSLGETLKFVYEYGTGASDATYGGYTTTERSDVAAGTTYKELAFSLNGSFYKLDAAVPFQYAAKYTPGAISFSVIPQGQSAKQMSINCETSDYGEYDIEVWSKVPTVTVSAVTPATTESIPTQVVWDDTGYSVSYDLTDNKYNDLDMENNTVYVYAKATTDTGSTGDASFVCPTLKFTVSGVDSSSTVKFTIPKGAAAKDINVSITGNAQSIEYILGNIGDPDYNKTYGAWIFSVTYTLDSYKGHEDQIIRTVTIVRNGVSYTVTLEKPIVIHNPSSNNKAG